MNVDKFSAKTFQVCISLAGSILALSVALGFAAFTYITWFK